MIRLGEVARNIKTEVSTSPVYYLGQCLALASFAYFVFCLTFPLGWEDSVEYFRWQYGFKEVQKEIVNCSQQGGWYIIRAGGLEYSAYCQPQLTVFNLPEYTEWKPNQSTGVN